ncbi:hypothetical protein BOTBODRAFT_57007 [Botryobasidium botryosum FD-172 SS1]|uniref:Zn(2)-C6 fungal-type domain-containing protein n=1 Tax=Botryobasidium botryosum (strain FD-172 SS1) TaxID=930990 RepID=A0A067M8Q2_BOTB1|nr:hypothetical protein BOTBODRAFT_57007 [Botryobasidium botryosum FD-172 SS1]
MTVGQPEQTPKPTKQPRAPRGTACVTCRAKKLRCDGTKPTCNTCLRNREPECTYNAWNFRPPTLLLQDRIEELESQIHLIEEAQKTPVEMEASSGGLSRDGVQSLRSSREGRGNMAGVQLLGASDPGSISLSSYFANLSSHAARDMPSMFSGTPTPFGMVGTTQLLVPPLSGSWWTTGEAPPASLADCLIESYRQNEHQFTYDFSPPEFFVALRNPDTSAGAHPALRNVVYLLGCFFHGGTLAALEPVFMRRATESLRHAIAYADRLIDFIEASCMFAVYHFYKLRHIEGHNLAQTAMLFAIACGLHTLKPPSWGQDTPRRLVLPPQTSAEIRRRVRVWWKVFCAERGTSTYMRLPLTLADEHIHTVWDAEAVEGDLSEDIGSVASLYHSELESTNVTSDSLNSLLCKSQALIERSYRLGTFTGIVYRPGDPQWPEYHATVQAISQVLYTLPSIWDPRGTTEGPTISGSLPGDSRVLNLGIVAPHIFCHDARIGLYKAAALAGDEEASALCLDSARTCIEYLHLLIQAGLTRQMSAGFTMCWVNVLQILCREVRRGRMAQDTMAVAAAEEDIQKLISVAEKMTATFPTLVEVIARMRQMFDELRAETTTPTPLTSFN